MSFRKIDAKQIEANRLYFSKFDNIMENAEGLQIFREYLEKQRNSEQILFLNKIKKIEEEHQYHVQRGLGRYTIQSYLAENSQFELNVSQELKEAALEWVDNTIDEPEFLSEEEELQKQKWLIGLFEKLKKEIRFQLAVECFPQFLESSVFKDFCSQYKPKPTSATTPTTPTSIEDKPSSLSSTTSKLSLLLKKQKSKVSSTETKSSANSSTTRGRTLSAASPTLPFQVPIEGRRRSLNDVEAIKFKRSSFESQYKQARNSGGSITEVVNPLIASFDVSFIFQKSIKDWNAIEVATWVDSTTALNSGSKKHMIDLELKGSDLLLLDDAFLDRCLGVKSKEERTAFLKEIHSVAQLRSNKNLGFE